MTQNNRSPQSKRKPENTFEEHFKELVRTQHITSIQTPQADDLDNKSYIWNFSSNWNFYTVSSIYFYVIILQAQTQSIASLWKSFIILRSNQSTNLHKFAVFPT